MKKITLTIEIMCVVVDSKTVSELLFMNPMMCKKLPCALQVILLVMTLTSVSPMALASAPHCGSLFVSKPESRFETDIVDAMSAAKRLRISADEIINIEGRLGTGGAYASAILKVRTLQGEFALKVYSESYVVRELAPSIVIQNALAKKGLAPAVHGILSAKEVRKLINKFPQSQKLIQDPDVAFAVLMDRVDVISHVSEGSVDYIPEGWSREKINQRISLMESAFSELRLAIPEDLQMVFDRHGNLLLLDFDTYAHLSKNGHAYGQFSADGERTNEDYMGAVLSKKNQMGQWTLLPTGQLKISFKKIRTRLGI